VLLHEGPRPTIERVRQKIGRGSPNTVSPMLERWFASLGQRLAAARIHRQISRRAMMPMVCR
jgi:transcriptional regulator with AAA-type ATPase domain